MGAIDPDHALLALVAQGDLRAFRELVGKHLNRGVKVAERMLGNRQDAEDVMQEVCLKVWKEAPRWQPRAKFSTWLYRVILNSCLDRKRRVVPFADNDALDLVMDDTPAADEQIMDAQKAKRVHAALQSLPERQRASIVLSYYEELPNQDAADCMGIGLGAFQQLLHRAKQNLKTSLGGAG